MSTAWGMLLCVSCGPKRMVLNPFWAVKTSNGVSRPKRLKYLGRVYYIFFTQTVNIFCAPPPPPPLFEDHNLRLRLRLSIIQRHRNARKKDLVPGLWNTVRPTVYSVRQCGNSRNFIIATELAKLKCLLYWVNLVVEQKVRSAMLISKNS